MQQLEALQEAALYGISNTFQLQITCCFNHVFRSSFPGQVDVLICPDIYVHFLLAVLGAENLYDGRQRVPAAGFNPDALSPVPQLTVSYTTTIISFLLPTLFCVRDGE